MTSPSPGGVGSASANTGTVKSQQPQIFDLGICEERRTGSQNKTQAEDDDDSNNNTLNAYVKQMSYREFLREVLFVEELPSNDERLSWSLVLRPILATWTNHHNDFLEKITLDAPVTSALDYLDDLISNDFLENVMNDSIDGVMQSLEKEDAFVLDDSAIEIDVDDGDIIILPALEVLVLKSSNLLTAIRHLPPSLELDGKLGAVLETCVLTVAARARNIYCGGFVVGMVTAGKLVKEGGFDVEGDWDWDWEGCWNGFGDGLEVLRNMYGSRGSRCNRGSNGSEGSDEGGLKLFERLIDLRGGLETGQELNISKTEEIMQVSFQSEPSEQN